MPRRGKVIIIDALIRDRFAPKKIGTDLIILRRLLMERKGVFVTNLKVWGCFSDLVKHKGYVGY